MYKRQEKERERERGRERERDRDRQTDRHRQRERDTHTQRQREKERERDAEGGGGQTKVYLHARRGRVVGEDGEFFTQVVQVGVQRVVEVVALLKLVTQTSVARVLLLHPA